MMAKKKEYGEFRSIGEHLEAFIPQKWHDGPNGAPLLQTHTLSNASWGYMEAICNWIITLEPWLSNF